MGAGLHFPSPCCFGRRQIICNFLNPEEAHVGDFSVWCDGLVHEVVIWRLEFGRQGWRGMCKDGVGFHVEAGRPRYSVSASSSGTGSNLRLEFAVVSTEIRFALLVQIAQSLGSGIACQGKIGRAGCCFVFGFPYGIKGKARERSLNCEGLHCKLGNAEWNGF